MPEHTWTMIPLQQDKQPEFRYQCEPVRGVLATVIESPDQNIHPVNLFAEAQVAAE